MAKRYDALRTPTGDYILTKEHFASLLRSEAELTAYEGAGVDNWEGAYHRWDELPENFHDMTDDEIIATYGVP